MNLSVSVNPIPEISAIYYGLLQTGYDAYAQERSPGHIAAIQRFAKAGPSLPFFARARQNTCAVYPYWPRAALLETAVFYLHANPVRFGDWEGFQRRVMSVGNLSPQERDRSFWDWIAEFPAELDRLLGSAGFRRYLEWEGQWLAEQTAGWHAEQSLLKELLAACQGRYGLTCRQVRLVVSPIKCVYSADFFWDGDCFVYSSGVFRASSVIHELLHPVLHPLISRQAGLLAGRTALFPEIDPSYYLTWDSAGWQNAFEEYAVRALTQRVLQGQFPERLEDFLRELLCAPK